MRRSFWIPMLMSVVLNGCNNASAEGDGLQAEVVTGSSALEAAHVAFAKGNFKDMGLAIKSVMFSDAEPEVKDNAIRLMDQAYRENCDLDFPVDWQLPDQVIRLYLDQGRNLEPDGIWYKMKMAGHLKSADAIQQLRLVQYPNKVIADKQAGLGEWGVEVDPNDPTDIYFELSKKYSKENIEPGLFLFELVTKDGKTTNGWFILNDQFSTASPEVATPAVGEHFATGTPSFRWNDFKSPEYKSCETRQLKIYVAKIPSDIWDLRWDLSKRDPVMTSATIGTDGNGRSLETGKYWFTLMYLEGRKFGDMELRRRSGTSRHFYVD